MFTRQTAIAVVILIGLLLVFSSPSLRADVNAVLLSKQGLRSAASSPNEHPRDEPPINESTVAVGESKPLLIIITPSSRPHYLTRSLFSILPLHDCFETRWVVSHDKMHPNLFHAPLFRGVFEWITEISSHNKKSTVGNHQRNFALAYVYKRWGDMKGHVYFLDDDNNMPDLCGDLRRTKTSLRSGRLYFADQHLCSSLRLGTATKSFDNVSTVAVQIRNLMDTGSFLSPIDVLKRENIEWVLGEYAADAFFFTTLIQRMLAKGEQRKILRLPTGVKFLYNDLSHCRPLPWNVTDLSHSLSLYRQQLQEMVAIRKSLPAESLMQRPYISFHEYVHVLHNIRTSMGVAPAMYVEIGVFKGATSLFLASHPQPTEVIGIDAFAMPNQRSETDSYVAAMNATSNIRFLSSASQTALPSLTTMLQGKQIDILFIDGDHSLKGATSDFELYSPLVRSGGYIVFDDFMDSRLSGGVRLAIMTLIRDEKISTQLYDVLGCVGNVARAGPHFIKDKMFYDWQRVTGNEYILLKR